jgi:hypothetical protein
MPNTKNLDAVRRAKDGRLMARSYEAGVCDHCSGFHFDLIDERGDIFATMILPVQALPVLAQAMIEHHDEIAGKVLN